jgi:hypothetical protein
VKVRGNDASEPKLKVLVNATVLEQSETDRDSTYGAEAVRLMMLQPLNMFKPLDLRVIHKTPSHEDERAE